MTLREALEILGPEFVRRGMQAIDDRRSVRQFGLCGTCFIGEGSGGTLLSYCKAKGYDLGAFTETPNPSIRQSAARAIEKYFECGKRAELHSEAIAFLAEHGEVPEPQLAVTV